MSDTRDFLLPDLGEGLPDATIVEWFVREGDTVRLDLSQRLAEAGFDPQQYLSQQYDFMFYYNDPALTGFSDARAYSAISLTDYNALMAMQGASGLQADGLPTLCDSARLITGYNSRSACIVVSDEVALQLSPRRQVFVADYQGDKQTVETALTAAFHTPEFYGEYSFALNTRIGIYMENMGSKILVLFMGLYLGMVFLLTAAAVLALQQLSQAADNVPRYQILARLGAPEQMRTRSVFAQVALSFFLPLALAIVHAAVGMTSANEVIAMVGRVDSVRSSLITAFFLILIYGGYFLATYFGSKRILRGR